MDRYTVKGRFSPRMPAGWIDTQRYSHMCYDKNKKYLVLLDASHPLTQSNLAPPPPPPANSLMSHCESECLTASWRHIFSMAVKSDLLNHTMLRDELHIFPISLLFYFIYLFISKCRFVESKYLGLKLFFVSSLFVYPGWYIILFNHFSLVNWWFFPQAPPWHGFEWNVWHFLQTFMFLSRYILITLMIPQNWHFFLKSIKCTFGVVSKYMAFYYGFSWMYSPLLSADGSPGVGFQVVLSVL